MSAQCTQIKTHFILFELIETQINLSLLPNKESLHTTMFLNHLATSILSNDANELSGRMKVEK